MEYLAELVLEGLAHVLLQGPLLGRRSIRALDEGRSCLHCRLSLFSVLNVQAATIPIFFRDLSLVLPLLGADDGHSNLAGEAVIFSLA